MAGFEAVTGTGLEVDLSVVAPAFNEEGNLRGLAAEVAKALEHLRWELILVDDGSRDATAEVIRSLAREEPRIRGVLLAENVGQSAALSAGLRRARGALVATLDADLQNDPADLPALMEALGDGDAVVGYRVKRRDGWVKMATSRIANVVRDRVSGDAIRDTGCGLKLFRAEALAAIPHFDGMHRFLPTLLRYQGFRVLEYPVNHRPRVSGVSKYGTWNRAWRGLVDLMAVRWMRSRAIRPVVTEEIGGDSVDSGRDASR